MITKKELEYIGYKSIAEYYEAIAQQIEQNNLSTAKEMESRLSRKQMQGFEDFISEAYYYELNDNTIH